MRGEELTEAQAKYVVALDSLFISEPPLDEEILVYRGCSEESFQRLEAGDYPSFLSTSRVEYEAREFARTEGDGPLLHIKLPKGFKSLRVSTEASLEKGELLLPRGLSFDVVEICSPLSGELAQDIATILVPSSKEYACSIKID